MSSYALWIADLASSVADFILSMNSLTISSPEGTWLGSKPIWGICPVSSVTVVLWTSSHILYGLPLYQKGNVSKATC